MCKFRRKEKVLDVTNWNISLIIIREMNEYMY